MLISFFLFLILKNLTFYILEESEEKEVKERRIAKKEEKEEGEEEEEEDEECVTCPLCQEMFKNKDTLEDHGMQIHSINSEGLARLMMLMQGSHWLNNAKNSKEEESGS